MPRGLAQKDAFGLWKPYLDPVSNMAIPESSAPKLKQKQVRLGFIAKELALIELFLRKLSQQQGQASIGMFV